MLPFCPPCLLTMIHRCHFLKRTTLRPTIIDVGGESAGLTPKKVYQSMIEYDTRRFMSALLLLCLLCFALIDLSSDEFELQISQKQEKIHNS